MWKINLKKIIIFYKKYNNGGFIKDSFVFKNTPTPSGSYGRNKLNKRRKEQRKIRRG